MTEFGPSALRLAQGQDERLEFTERIRSHSGLFQGFATQKSVFPEAVEGRAHEPQKDQFIFAWTQIEKAPLVTRSAFFESSEYGNRTRATGVRGRRPNR